ncbi:conserved hypothetical protein [Candidatus Nitrosymbiomonas proteolyticus]|uniref:Uncharacterized protein n=1 Tax=Candidatus Nitrosymbiomonas proteolyticus TaxID=2608984 RepID=A0A809R6A5_9BACT|nr:conserved hypothetical protein [Candidatus Nitrosymbiomonas proteolyticus]
MVRLYLRRVKGAELTTLDELWNSTSPSAKTFSDAAATLDEPVRAYFARTFSPGAVLPRAARLRMHGEIKLNRWLPFEAEQVIHLDRGMVWKAKVRMGRMRISGWDRVIGGRGDMVWKLFGLVPMLKSSGPNVDRSAIGRYHAESIWLPSRLLERAEWLRSSQQGSLEVSLSDWGQATTLRLTTNQTGDLVSVASNRWGNPQGKEYAEHPFGAWIEESRAFEGITIPTKVRVGWFFGSPQFETDGEFFRAEVTSAIFK